MKILLLGKSGQLGWELQRALAPLGELIAPGRTGAGTLCGDLSRLDQIRQTVHTVRPQVIVNAAAYTAVDQAEREAQAAEQINAHAPAVLAQAAADAGAWLVHYSTDYVFDGSGSQPWLEHDATAPLNVYGRTKLAGEHAILHSRCKHLIFRTSWVYAARGQNFARTMLRLAQERDTLSVIDDQVGAPTGADLIADVTAHALRTVIPPRGHNALHLSGLYHLAAAGATSWHGYACRVLAWALEAGVQLRVAPHEVKAIASSQYPAAAQRPLNSRLDTHKLQATFGLTLPHWEQGVVRMLTEVSGGA